MSGEDWLRVLTLALALVLPLSSLRHHRLGGSRWLLMVAVWLGIFLAAAAIFGQFRPG